VDLKAIDIRDIVLTGLATLAAALLAPSFAVIAVPLGALATGWLSYRFGTRAGVVAAVIATSVVTAAMAAVSPQSAASALFTLPALLAAGPGTVWALKRWKLTSVIAVATAIMFVALVASLSLETAVAHTTIAREWDAAVRPGFEQAIKSAASQPGGQATAKQMAAWLPYALLLWPSSLFLITALTAAFAVPAVSWLGRRMGAAVATLPALADLDLSFHLVWPSIAGLALLAVDAIGKGSSGLALAVGANLLIAVRPALFIQGMAAFASLYRRVGVGRFGRAFGFFLLGISEAAVPSVSVVGVADLFFNPRKLPRDGAGVAPDPA
jgi:hypothetical protein